MNKKITSKVNIALLVTLSSLVLYFSLKDNFSETVKEILTLNLGWFLLGLLLMFGYWFFRAIAFHSLIIKFDKTYRFRRTFSLMLLSQFFNGITPMASGGQPFVVYKLKQDGIRTTDGTNVVVQDFIIYQIALITLGVLAIIYNYYFNVFKEVGLLKELVLIGFLLNVGAIVLMFMVAFGRKMNKIIISLAIHFLTKIKVVKNKEKTLAKWDVTINNFHEGASILFKDKKHFIKTIGINMVALMSLYIIPVTLLYGMGNYVAFTAILAIVTSAYINLVGSMVPMPGGTGGLEFAFVAFFGNFLGGSVLSALMLLWRFVTYYLGMIIGFIVFNIWRRRE